MVKLGRPRKF